jgi:glucose/arabinose dehydrogenase
MRHARVVVIGLISVAALAVALATLVGARERARGQSDWLEGKNLSLSAAVKGLKEPTYVTGPPDTTGRLFILEQAGLVRIAQQGALRPQPALDLTDQVSTTGEQGLLGLAFDPHFTNNGLVYVDYTAKDKSVRVVRYQVAAGDPNQLDPGTAHPILDIPKNGPYHNGGMLAFGPDGYLYVSVGDDERGLQAQNLGSLYGKLLRLDVDGGDPYAIPPTNPFADPQGGRPEIWAYGLRNPWRFSFDRQTGDLWIGDVHQVDEGSNSREVVDFQPASSGGGENYGFPILEAFRCSGADPTCRPPGVTLPIIGYEHNMNCSVTGGYVYRGHTATNFVGTYLFGDFCTGGVFAARPQGPGGWQRVELGFQPIKISSFGEDANGDVYVVDLQGGVIYRVEGGSLP